MTTTVQPILISMPRYVSIPRIAQRQPDVVVAVASKPAQPPQPETAIDPVDEFLVRGKKRRLDHLSWEEKFQRKKLKNRVAAQTSRDRKKAKLDEIEFALQHMTDQNDALQRTCTALKLERDDARALNAQLEQQIAELTQRLNKSEAAAAELKQQQQHAIDVAARLSGCGSQPQGSAESETIPLPQEREPQSTRRSAVGGTPSSSYNSSSYSNNSETAALWKIIALCLLYRTYSSSSTPAASKSWPKVCSQMSSQTWQKILRRAASELPRMKAPQSECLDQWWGPSQRSWNPPKIVAAV